MRSSAGPPRRRAGGAGAPALSSHSISVTTTSTLRLIAARRKSVGAPPDISYSGAVEALSVTVDAVENDRMIRARNATLAVFAVSGFAFSSWMARVPDVKAGLHLSPGRLSVLLLSISIGSVLGLPLAGRLNHHLGAAAVVRLGAGVSLPGIALAAIAVQAKAPLSVIAIGLFLMGLGIGLWDVSQNLEGTIVERGVGKAIMPWFHAAFSMGTVFGALIGALMTFLRVPVGVHVSVAAGLGLAVIYWSTARFVPAMADVDHVDGPAPPPARSAWLEPRTLLIGVMVLAAAFTEGTANDWMAVAFVDGHHTAKALGVVALAVFLTFMTCGRIVGTHLLETYGRVVVLRILFSAAIAGCLLVVFGYTWLAYVGAAVWGVGASLGFPVGMSAAADEPRRAAVRLSVVSTIGYGAFLAGPPLLGFLGDHFGVLHALLVVGAVSILATLVVPVARPPVPAD